MVSQGNFALVGAIPSADSYGRRQAARAEAIQLQSAITQNQELELAKEQQAAAALEQQKAALRNIPFEGTDRIKLAGFLRDTESQLAKRLQQYNGNLQQFYAAEGARWHQQVSTALRNSPFFQQALINRQNVEAARQAIQKGEVITGRYDDKTGKLISGESMLSQFLGGRADRFDYLGSYKREDDLKPLRDVYAPGKPSWEPTAVSEQDKVNHLINVYGYEVGMDKYYRQHKGVPTMYKYDPIEKKTEFGWKAEDQQMQKGRYGMEQGRYQMAKEGFALDQTLKGLRIAEKTQELNGGTDAQGRAFIEREAAHANKMISIPNVGNMPGFSLHNDGVEVMATSMGLQKTKDGIYKGRLGKVLTEKGDTLDLSGIGNVGVVSIEPTQYFTGMGPNGKFGKDAPGFARITVKFNDPYQAEKVDLYDPNWKFLPDWQTEKGTGVYNPNTQEATFIVPTGNINPDANRPYNRALQQKNQGQDKANKDYDGPALFNTYSFEN